MKPAPAIGLRMGVRTSGERYLHGLAAETFTVEKGSRVQLRRLRPDGNGDGATHVIVFAPPAPNVSSKDLEAACLDAAWYRVDPRDGTEQSP